MVADLRTVAQNIPLLTEMTPKLLVHDFSQEEMAHVEEADVLAGVHEVARDFRLATIVVRQVHAHEFVLIHGAVEETPVGLTTREARSAPRHENTG